jgi:hypothetical protein
VAPSYQVTNWLEGGVGFAYTNRDSDLPVGNLYDYNRKEFFARLRASY